MPLTEESGMRGGREGEGWEGKERGEGRVRGREERDGGRWMGGGGERGRERIGIFIP